MTPSSPVQSAPQARPLVVMAKPVGSRCNMRCSYCYYLDKGRYSSHARQSRMSFGLLERLVRQTIEASPGPVVSFVWHGGEPALAGMDFYRRALELQRKYLPAGWRAWNNLQTNGLLLSEAWCRFLGETGFDVGLSIDGSAPVHDANRRDLGGQPTFSRVREAALRLKRHGVTPDLLCTVNSASLRDPQGVYEAIDALDCGWVQFIPIVAWAPDGSPSPESVSPEGYGRFLCQIFDLWASRGLGRLDVQLFAEMARIMAGGSPSLCWMAPECGMALVAEEDGSVYACDHFVDDGHRLGNLMSVKLRDLADSPRQRRFGSYKREGLTAQCRRCKWYRFCGGGCPKDRVGVSKDGESGHYWLCQGLEALFEHATPILERIMELSRQGKTPQEIMKILQATPGST